MSPELSGSPVLGRLSVCSRVLLPVTALLSLGFLFLLSARPAIAQVVYDGGAPNQFSAYISAPSFGDGFFQAETFTLANPISFNVVEWYGVYGSENAPVNDAFTISFFSTTSGVPNTTPIAGLSFSVGNNVNRMATGQTLSVYGEYSYSSALPGSVNLPAGTYGISIVNDTTADVDDTWSWETTAPIRGGEHYFRQTSGGAWTSTVENLSFRLLNTTSTAAPEPGSLALLVLTGLPVFCTVIQRKRGSHNFVVRPNRVWQGRVSLRRRKVAV